MNICKLTNKELAYYNTVTTTEGHKIHNSVYHIATNFHRKGTVSLAECKEALKAKKDVEKATEKYLSALRKKIVLDKELKEDYARQQVIKENDYSKKTFSKVREVIDHEEYVQMINELYPDIAEYKDKQYDNKYESSGAEAKRLLEWGRQKYPTAKLKEVFA